MRILVYDVAASESGALSVLMEFYARALEDKSNEYLFLVSTPALDASRNVSVSRFPWVKRSWAHRLWFDYVIGPSLARRWGPDKVLSLQNTMMPRVARPQVVYEHNCLPRPFSDYRFSLIEEPMLWVRQNILGSVIARSLKRAQHVVVQTSWMKRRCVENLGIPADSISVEPPRMAGIAHRAFSPSEPFVFVYPATAMRFKNHELIVNACKILVDTDVPYRVLFTLSGSETKHIAALKRESEAFNLPIEFVGWQSRDGLYDLYGHSALVFVSQLESYPLPLMEARKVGNPIIVPDAEYAHEILDDGEAFFYIQNDAASLAGAMGQMLRDRGRLSKAR